MLIKTMNGECPCCCDDRKCSILFAHKISFAIQKLSMSIWNKYIVLQCTECESIFYLTETWSSKDYEQDGIYKTYHPTSMHTTASSKLLNTLAGERKLTIMSVYKEVITAANNNLAHLTSSGIKNLIDIIALDVTKHPGEFSDNLFDFQTVGYISEEQRLTLIATIGTTNNSSHLGHSPPMREIIKCIEIIENIIEHIYANGDEDEDKVENIKVRKPLRLLKHKTIDTDC